MSRKNEIRHDGRIVEITPEFTTVEILVSSACAACHAKGLCGMSEAEEKVIMVPTDPYAEHKVGDKVIIMTKMSMGMKAVWISYVVPLIILMILILSLSEVFDSQMLCGLTSIGGVAVYYLIIWLLRGKLQNEFGFYLE